jgi:broad specificity phosphatase PhoE
MTRLYLVRHARPAAAWGEEPDPALDAVGREQAELAAQTLTETLQPVPIYTSPLRRCRETAQPLEQLWRRPAEVFEPVAELPMPSIDHRARQRWLEEAMGGTWQGVNRSAPPGSPDYRAWREGLLKALARMPRDSVIFTHFIAINVVVGAAQRRDDVVCFRPDHASITCVEIENDKVRLLELGRQSDTSVLARG